MEKEVQAGQLIAGKYRLEQTLGRGGMGVVMAALHEQLNQRVALKFLTDNAYQQQEAVARFVREARAAVQIQSEHVARVMDVGTLDSGAPYMVMEYLRGQDLKEVSTRRGPLPVSEAVDYVLQACDAVAEAHSLGIVHRDLKPSNLFLTERPDGSPLVKVLDFGISKALHAGERSSQLQMTASAAIMGSPQYMSPEQIRSSKNVDARADVWALGTILHELLTGGPAYVADTVPGLLAMIVADAPPPLSNSRPDAPPELEATILRCLQKDRERRFRSVAALARALERFASSDTKLLVRRIARVLGDDAAPETELEPLAPALTVHEPVGQTNGTFSRTGRREVAASSPLYARADVQLGTGVGALALGVIVWLLAAGSGAVPEMDAELQLNATAAAPLSAPEPPAAAPLPVLSAPSVAPVSAAPVAAAAPAPPPAALAPTTSGVRPVVEQAQVRPIDSATPTLKSGGPIREAKAAATAGAKKAPAPRPSKPAPKAPRATAKPSPESDPAPAAAAPVSPAKKKTDVSEDLGLFDDTK